MHLDTDLEGIGLVNVLFSIVSVFICVFLLGEVGHWDIGKSLY